MEARNFADMRVLNKSFDLLARIGKEQIAVAELEALGLPLRTINMLEQSLGAIWLEDLLKFTPDQIRERVSNLGEKGVQQILECLERFDQIESEKRLLPQRFNMGPLPRPVMDEEETTAG